ncbi:MAG: rhodanese-like domain-containing protein [Bryobacteraceae bacterium]
MEGLPVEISVLEVKRRLEAGEAVRLIDVREPQEFAMCRIEGAELIPMRSIPKELAALKEKTGERALVFYCHHGPRSLQVVTWLRQRGLAGCQSMQGGIDRWAASVDPGVRRY